MNISLSVIPYILFFVCVVPAILAVYLAGKQGRSKILSGLITFMLGLLTWVGGWLYLGLMNLVKPKKTLDIE
jgi:hypothetical protein